MLVSHILFKQITDIVYPSSKPEPETVSKSSTIGISQYITQKLLNIIFYQKPYDSSKVSKSKDQLWDGYPVNIDGKNFTFNVSKNFNKKKDTIVFFPHKASYQCFKLLSTLSENYNIVLLHYHYLMAHFLTTLFLIMY